MYRYLFFHFRRSGQYVNGWFLRLCYGHHHKRSCHINDIQLNSINSCVKVVIHRTNETKICSIVVSFHGVESCDGRHKPVMNLAIMYME